MKFPNLENEKLLTIDIETEDPDLNKNGTIDPKNAIIAGVGIATKEKEWYFPLNHLQGGNIDSVSFYSWLKTLEDKIFLGANIMYDLQRLTIQGFSPKKNYDIQFAEPLLNENKKSYSLESLAIEYLNQHKEEKELKDFCEKNNIKRNPKKLLRSFPAELTGKYCKKHCRLTYDIFEKQKIKLEEQELWGLFKLECNLIPLLLLMKKTGVRIDQNILEINKNVYADTITRLEKELQNQLGFFVNVSAAESLKKAFEKLKIPYGYTEKGNASFSASALENLAGNPFIDIVLELKHLKKIYSTYLEGLENFLIDGRLYTDFNSLRSDSFGTVTGRFSSSNPNLQNVPSKGQYKKDIRSMFIPEENHTWLRGDYSQIELRMLAHYAVGPGADKIREMYINNPRVDFHQACADMIGIPRKPAKTINFGVVYGMGAAKMSRSLGKTEDEGTKFIRRIPILYDGNI